KAFNGLIDDENIHVYIHIKAAVCNVTSISGVNNNGKTIGVDIIWWIPKKAISVIKTITNIKTNNTVPCADQVMALFKTVAIGVFISALPKRPALKNSAASILFLVTIGLLHSLICVAIHLFLSLINVQRAGITIQFILTNNSIGSPVITSKIINKLINSKINKESSI